MCVDLLAINFLCLKLCVWALCFSMIVLEQDSYFWVQSFKELEMF